jgi:hypothetical protein
MQQLLVVSSLLKLCWGHSVQKILLHLQLPWLYWLLLFRQLYQMSYREPNQLLQCLSTSWNLLLVLFFILLYNLWMVPDYVCLCEFVICFFFVLVLFILLSVQILGWYSNLVNEACYRHPWGSRFV